MCYHPRTHRVVLHAVRYVGRRDTRIEPPHARPRATTPAMQTRAPSARAQAMAIPQLFGPYHRSELVTGSDANAPALVPSLHPALVLSTRGRPKPRGSGGRFRRP